MYLNEGFATFMQYLCINTLYPEFEVFNDFCLETFVPALGMDGLTNTHPVEVPLKDASEISQVFDKITYCKGASVIFMLHQYIGHDDFRTGIRYLDICHFGCIFHYVLVVFSACGGIRTGIVNTTSFDGLLSREMAKGASWKRVGCS